MNTKYSKEEFINAVRTSYSIAECLRKLGLVASGSNYKTFKQLTRQLNIDTSHFRGQRWLKGQKHSFNKKKPLEEILVQHSTYQTSLLKKRLLQEGLLEEKCYSCNRTEWMDQPIPLEVDHKNGVNDDHRIENLSLVCPNCHAFTPTYRGRQLKGRRWSQSDPRKKKRKRRPRKDYGRCLFCRKRLIRKQKRFCSQVCSHSYRSRCPTKEQLQKDIGSMSWLAMGKKYGVSDNAVRKWARKYNLLD